MRSARSTRVSFNMKSTRVSFDVNMSTNNGVEILIASDQFFETMFNYSGGTMQSHHMKFGGTCDPSVKRLLELNAFVHMLSIKVESADMRLETRVHCNQM
jgi:hypothetical protein